MAGSRIGPTVLAVLGALLAAGCTSPASGPTDDGTEAGPTAGSEPVSGAPLPPPDVGDVALIDQAHWSDCWGIYSHFIWPGTMAPGGHPDGWEPEATYYATEVRLIAMECSRLSWGNLERGPIRFVVEYHNNHGVPDACRAESGPIQYWLLNALWVDDQQVADELRAEEGLPTVFAPIELDIGDVGSLLQRTASWQGSTLESYQESASATTTSMGAPKRLFWPNAAGGITWMDFDVEAQTPDYGDRLTRGTMQDPMLMAGVGPAYAATGGAFDDGSMGGEIARFQDLKCERPV